MKRRIQFKRRPNEDKRLEPYKVWFTPSVSQEIELIKTFNRNNVEGLQQLQEYLQRLRSYVSNPVIAWDNVNKYSHHPNGATHINELGYNFTYFIKNSKFDNKQYVCIVKIYYNLTELGLRNPFAANANSQGGAANPNNEVDAAGNIIKDSLQRKIDDIITETLHKFLHSEKKSVLNENANNRRINKLISTAYSTTDFNEIRQIRANILNLIPKARARNEKWLYKILQYMIDGEITQKDYKPFNKFLDYLQTHNVDDANINASNFNNVPFSYIRNYYEKLFPKTERNAHENTLSSKVKHVNGFTIRRIDSGYEARQLAQSVYASERWCILHGMFDNCVDDCTCYIITNDKTFNNAKEMSLSKASSILSNMGEQDIANDIKGWEEQSVNDITDVENDDYFELAYLDNGLPPYDTYGLSAIVVLVGEDGDLYGCYSRYNIPNMYDGSMLDKMELSKMLDADIDEVCPYVSRERLSEQKIRKIIRESIHRTLMKYA